MWIKIDLNCLWIRILKPPSSRLANDVLWYVSNGSLPRIRVELNKRNGSLVCLHLSSKRNTRDWLLLIGEFLKDGRFVEVLVQGNTRLIPTSTKLMDGNGVKFPKHRFIARNCCDWSPVIFDDGGNLNVHHDAVDSRFLQTTRRWSLGDCSTKEWQFYCSHCSHV